ncbi:tRNA (cytidine/uridine-2'-O-)-methyltransferase TrmJ [Spirochaetia bacterium]|nr:tRNA (cytidine/uridine-2'-O-)-methyltransferase TrmJ [Spirochaetia bacterium]
MRLHDITIVLARPSEPGNTGAVCRAMKNMGLHRLRIAAPEWSGGLEKLLARAVHAADIWETAEHFNSLEAALADCTLSVGTSRRRGRYRKSNTLTARELATFLKDKDGSAAIVFGSERTGLSGEELELCNMASHIPVSPVFPSMNLSHAVQVYAYELYQVLTKDSRGSSLEEPRGPNPVPGQWVPMTAAEINTMVRSISDSLASTGFYKHPGRAEQERFLRDIFARSGLSLSEGRYLSTIISKAGRLGSKFSNPD